MELGLKGKTIIVTGGNSNIGRGITLGFAAEGCKVVIAAKDEVAGQKVIDLAKKQGGNVIMIKTDITKYDEVEALVKKTIERFGKIDVLVNNVGWEKMTLFVDYTPEFWNKIIDINLRGMLNCSRVVLPHMIERKAGVILVISSDAGRTGDVRESVYAGCKAAEITVAKAIARENAQYGIRCNAICPGWTLSPQEELSADAMSLGRVYKPETIERVIKERYPLGRTTTPQDIANASIFLASDAASFITGQTLSVSGGNTMI